jgi:membrane protein
LTSKERIQKLKWGDIFHLVKKTILEFFQEQSFFHGAALSYYAVFALVPMIYLALISFGKIVGQDMVLKIIDSLLKEQVGLQDSSGLMQFLEQADFYKSSIVMNIIGIVVLLLTSTAMLQSLRTSINEFYDIKVDIADRRKRLEYTIGTKLVSIFLLPVFASVLMIMYFGETFVLSLGYSVFGEMNGFETFVLDFSLNAFSILMNGLLFTIVFKYVHDGFVPFKIAFGGGLVTSILLWAGQLGIKFYLQNYFFGSKAGVAGTILVLLAWMYYTSQIIFLGAKFTKVYAVFVGKPIHFQGRKVSTKKIIAHVSGKNKK